ncbi:4-oxalomesaconate tautomerase [Thioclava sp. GXIMD4216]|uniref:4-oxalomesaconate tautomerase n=1 Tax=Thioclava sp. GXIMD4216 TaxID=3131929 RepID=UPI0030CBCB3D
MSEPQIGGSGDGGASEGIACLWMRGGTSKGAYFRASDLPADRQARDALLLRIMGSPDPRQIDGIGGADPLTSKVAILSPPSRDDADIDYLFLQVFVDQALVSDAQACGNILAGVGPAALELGLVAAQEGETSLRIHMRNTGEIAEATVQTPQGRVSYRGTTAIDGVPGTAAPVRLLFSNLAGSMCGHLFPTGQPRDWVDGIAMTLIDYGMPVALVAAQDLGLTGQESRETLEGDMPLRARLEALRLQVGPLMGLGDVSEKSVPKMTILSAAQEDGVIATRSFIPHRCHASIGVFAAISVASACTIEGTVAAPLARLPEGETFRIEHPTGAADIVLRTDGAGYPVAAGSVRTARKLFAGQVFAD